MSWRKGEGVRPDTPRCDTCEDDLDRADVCEGESLCWQCRAAAED